MRYQVKVVEDSELPCGVDYTFVRAVDRTCLFVKRSAFHPNPDTGECDALSRAFETWERRQSVELKELAHTL